MPAPRSSGMLGIAQLRREILLHSPWRGWAERWDSCRQPGVGMTGRFRIFSHPAVSHFARGVSSLWAEIRGSPSGEMMPEGSG